MHIHDKCFASPSPWVSDNANNVVKANLNFAVCIPSHADISNYISLIIQSSHQFDDTCQMVNLLINILIKTLHLSFFLFSKDLLQCN